MASTLNDLLIEIQELVEKLEVIGFGGSSESVVYKNVSRPTLQKEISDRFQAIQALASGYVAYETKAELEAAGSLGGQQLAKVWNDSNSINNGTYGFDGLNWIKSEYDIEGKFAIDLNNIDSDLSALSKELVLDRIKSQYRDGISEKAWSIIDRDGKIAFAIDANGDCEVHNIKSSINKAYRDYYQKAWSISDSEGRAALSVNLNGQVEFSEVVATPHNDRPRDGGVRFLWSIKDSLDRVSIGIYEDGSVYLNASPAFANSFQTAGYIAPAMFSEKYNVFNVRGFGQGYIASKQDSDKFVYDIRTRDKSVGDFALVESAKPINYMPFAGQSNSGSGGSTGVLFEDQPYPHHCVTFKNLNHAYGTVLADASEYVDLISDGDKGRPAHFPATLSAVSLEGLSREFYGAPTSGFLVHTSWYGGQPLSAFIRGTDSWNNLINIAVRAKAVVAEYGRTVDCKYFTYIQGETSSPDYSAEFVNYATDVTNELGNVFSVASPYFVYLQINSSDSATIANGIEQEQFNVAVQNNNGRMVLAGPMYDAPLGDNIHQSPLGRMIIGDRLAACYMELDRNNEFKPLWPISVSLVGDVIQIDYHVPGAGLSFDSDWVPAVPDFGFVYEDDSSSASIQSVEIVGLSRIHITLSAVPAGLNPKISYAVLNDTTQNGWANGRGLLYSKSSYKSEFFKRGYSIPEYVRHYCVRFAQEL